MKDARTYITKSRGGHYTLTVIHQPTGQRVTYGKNELCTARYRVAEAMHELEQRVAAYQIRLAEHNERVRATA